MALLDAARLQRAVRRWMQENDQLCPALKDDVKAMFAALDPHREATWAAVNAAIPQPARGALTRKQKALAFKILFEEAFKLES